MVFEDAIDFAANLSLGRGLLGLDPGTKTIGVALSDPLRLVASAHETIQRRKFLLDAARLSEIFAARDLGGIVIGLPYNMDGSEGPRAQSARALARSLSHFGPFEGQPILLWDERLSTVAAEKALLAADTSRKRRNEVIDQVAASVILQGALDRLRVIEDERGSESQA